MPSSARPDGQFCPAQDEVNTSIRRLMTSPATTDRTEAYARLLRQWADACNQCPGCPLQNTA